MPEILFNKVAGQGCNFINKESLVQVLSCEFCEISNNTFFIEYPRTTASTHTMLYLMEMHKSLTKGETHPFSKTYAAFGT